MKSTCNYAHALKLRVHDLKWLNSIKGKRPNQSVAMKKKWSDPESASKYLKVIGTNHQPEYLDRRGRLWRFKSTWELIFAKWLDAQEKSWLYEPCVLLLSDGSCYFPDFWIEEQRAYVEIKALHRSDRKVLLAQKDGHQVIFLRGREALDAFMQTSKTLRT